MYMSTKLWPPISPSALEKEVRSTLHAEQSWLLQQLRLALPGLKSGIQECLSLLTSPVPSTLPLSSHRSETVKGILTRTHTHLSIPTLSLRLQTLSPLSLKPPPGGASAPLPQLSSLLELLNTSLDIIDVSSWTGDPTSASFMAGQLRLLSESIGEAAAVLRGISSTTSDNDAESTITTPSPPAFPQWWEQNLQQLSLLFGELPKGLVPHLTLADGAIVLTVRVLGPPPPPKEGGDVFAMAGRLGRGFGLGGKVVGSDEVEGTFEFAGESVGVREKVRVESADPGLVAIGAKLGVLGRGVGEWRGKVAVVMGEEL